MIVMNYPTEPDKKSNLKSNFTGGNYIMNKSTALTVHQNNLHHRKNTAFCSSLQVAQGTIINNGKLI